MKVTVGNLKRFDKVTMKIPPLMGDWLETLSQADRRMVVETLLDSVEVLAESEEMEKLV